MTNLEALLDEAGFDTDSKFTRRLIRERAMDKKATKASAQAKRTNEAAKEALKLLAKRMGK